MTPDIWGMVWFVVLLALICSALFGDGAKDLPGMQVRNLSISLERFYKNLVFKRTKLEQLVAICSQLYIVSCAEAVMFDLDREYREARKKVGLTTEQLACYFELDLAVVVGFERGETRPGASFVQALKGLAASGVGKFVSVAEFVNQIEPEQVGSLSGRSKQKSLGQFFTSKAVSDFMATMFSAPAGSAKLLDAGAGDGALSKAFAEKWYSVDHGRGLEIEAYEIDAEIIGSLRDNLGSVSNAKIIVRNEDFLEVASRLLPLQTARPFSHVIMNPPYKKISSDSSARKYTRAVGFETVNLYSAFVGAGLSLLRTGGELVAIIPRSFCNGPYFRDFRRFVLANGSIDHIHLFGSRDSAFRKDSVLQENVILKLSKNVQSTKVRITESTNENFSDLRSDLVSFGRVVIANDDDQFIHIPQQNNSKSSADLIGCDLATLELSCSTGPVVDFRVKDFLRSECGPDCVPLLYPGHFQNQFLSWPKERFKKANAIVLNSETQSSVWQNGYYVVIRRFSSKEEKRRIFASVVEPHLLANPKLAFENHLNVLHKNRGPLSKDLALGLCAYLNSNLVDRMFRSFSGHTQVNATDIRKLKFPALDELIALGSSSRSGSAISQSHLSDRLRGLMA